MKPGTRVVFVESVTGQSAGGRAVVFMVPAGTLGTYIRRGWHWPARWYLVRLDVPYVRAAGGPNVITFEFPAERLSDFVRALKLTKRERTARGGQA